MSSSSAQQKFWLLKIVMLVAIGGILYGYDIGVISGALLFIKKTIPMSSSEIGLIVGAVLAGGLVGTLIAGPLADSLGRRSIIMFASTTFIVGVCSVLIADTFTILLIARFILGIGVGVVAVAVPLYVSELVPACDRGKYVTFFQLFLTFGILLAYGVDLFFGSTGNWHAMFAFVLIPATILLIGGTQLPESPRWLVSKGRLRAARAVLGRTFSAKEADRALIEIHNSTKESSSHWSALFSTRCALPLFIACSIAILNQWTGINAFLQYAPLLFKQAGISSNAAALIASMGIGAINFLCTALALCFIDRVGRKKLLILGITGIIASECFLGVVTGSAMWHPSQQGLYAMYGLFSFIFFYAIGPGVVVWLSISELFPTQVRGKGMAVCLFLNSLAGTLLASFFMNLEHWVHLSGAYFLCAGCSVVYLCIASALLPETKDKTLESIQHDFSTRSSLLNPTALTSEDASAS